MVTLSLAECRELMLIVATLRFVLHEGGGLGVGKVVQRKVDVMSRRTGMGFIGASDTIGMFFLALVS
jgi:hypothetical protein